MGGKNYNQKSVDNERRIAAAEQQAQGEWAQGVFARLVGKEVTVKSLGRCTVLGVDMATRRVVVRPVQGDAQLYEASFRAVTLGVE